MIWSSGRANLLGQLYIKFSHGFLKQGHSDYYYIHFCHRVANNDL
jgi:hypothetical protein